MTYHVGIGGLQTIMELKAIVGKNIVKYRKDKNLTQQDLAYRADISVSHLRNIERGQVNTTLDIVERVSRSLDIPPVDLFNR